MGELKTKPSLLDALRKAASEDVSAEEIQSQRVSFIMGMLNKGSSATRAKVVEVLRAQEEKKSA